MAYQRGTTWFIRVPTRDGEVIRSTGSRERATATLHEAMLAQLGPRGQRDWFLLEQVAKGEVSLAELYDAYHDGKDTLDGLRKRLQGHIADPDLEPYVSVWLKWVKSQVDADTCKRYERYVRTLMPADVPLRRSALTAERVMGWLSSLTYEVKRRDRKQEKALKQQLKKAKARGEHLGDIEVEPIYIVEQRESSSGTKRKYWAALASFCDYLVKAKKLTENVAHEVDAPKQGDPRCEHLSLRRVQALITAQPEPYRTFSMLLHATGMEVSAALRATKRHFSFRDRSIRGLGTKWKKRDRITFIAAWAWPHIRAYVAKLEADELLFAGIDRWRALEAHKAACKKLGITNYTQHDARHSYAVHAIRCGASFEHVAEQLGHVDTQMAIRVYARFHPSARERMGWEARSDAVVQEDLAEEAEARRTGPGRGSKRARPGRRSGERLGRRRSGR
ncbi:MAG TPA: tyrosine-type recombinase/integrase [Gemmatimonadales bacterium]|nr:tyrosine-type recombinase/integrase [Gemmatimonadales bacterium]